LTHRGKFQECLDYLLEKQRKNLKYEDKRETLLNFIADLPDRDTFLKLKPLIEESGHK